ncbi:2-oxo acid dehydrogenase subunit E2 [Streptomyces sp. NA02950]|uniref:2-oxo acid dehydrogenase subunit E2 n=1 Tax=Streptomyces sp. NA02950 TaxID=2742137 RepID=UPI00159072E1|nr:2-oxo acid dehydrogenase subunit E2 [Streptomyces sp. NA02950]QKV94600.1 2-oxo acid dehydrogenase subunit E2 [Streptomyces sp. NA02950]
MSHSEKTSPAAPSRGFPKGRSHIYYFVRQSRQLAPCSCLARVDMARVREAQRTYRERGHHISTTSFIAKAAALAIRKYPEANVAVRRTWVPKVHAYETIDCKVLFDKEIRGVASVSAAVLPRTDQMDLVDIQRALDHHRKTPYEQLEELRGLRALHRLPLWLGRIVHHLVTRDPKRRGAIEGGFAVTRLGDPRITAAYPQTVNTLSFVGAATVDTPVARDGHVLIRPVMELVLAFDHAALDGALAARVLNETCRILEDWSES